MLTGKYRRGERAARKASAAACFQAENSEQRTAILDTLIAVAK